MVLALSPCFLPSLALPCPSLPPRTIVFLNACAIWALMPFTRMFFMHPTNPSPSPMLHTFDQFFDSDQIIPPPPLILLPMGIFVVLLVLLRLLLFAVSLRHHLPQSIGLR